MTGVCVSCPCLCVCWGFASVCIAPLAAPYTPSLCRDINIFAAFFSSLPRGCGRAILRVVGEGPDVNLNRRGAASSNLLPPLPILLACYSKAVYTAPRFVYLLALLFAGHLYISTSFTPTPRSSGNERSMLILGGSMRRLNAHGRSSTVRSQRPQPTGAVDLALEPLTFACDRDTSSPSRLRHWLTIFAASFAHHATRLLRACQWQDGC